MVRIDVSLLASVCDLKDNEAGQDIRSGEICRPMETMEYSRVSESSAYEPS